MPTSGLRERTTYFVEVGNKMRSFALSELLELSLEPVNVLLFLAIVNRLRRLIVFYSLFARACD